MTPPFSPERSFSEVRGWRFFGGDFSPIFDLLASSKASSRNPALPNSIRLPAPSRPPLTLFTVAPTTFMDADVAAPAVSPSIRTVSATRPKLFDTSAKDADSK